MHKRTRARTAPQGPSPEQLAELAAMHRDVVARATERSTVQNTIAALRYYQAARRAGVAVYLTTDPAWLVDTAINRRAGWPEDPHARVTVNAPRLYPKATGDAERELVQIAAEINAPRTIVRPARLGRWRRYLMRRLPHRLTTEHEIAR